MRTTVRLDDDLLAQVKRHAAARGESLTCVLDRALREMLARQEAGPRAEGPELPSFSGRGLQPGVDLYDTAALVDLMDDAG